MAENSGDVISATGEVSKLLAEYPHAENIAVKRAMLETLLVAADYRTHTLTGDLSEIAVKELLEAISFTRTDPVLGALHAGLAKSLLALEGGMRARRAEDEIKAAQEREEAQGG